MQSCFVGRFAHYLAGLALLPTLVKTESTGLFEAVLHLKHDSHVEGLLPSSHKALCYHSGPELTLFPTFNSPSTMDLCEDWPLYFLVSL